MSLRAYLAQRSILEEWGPPARRLAHRLYQRNFFLALVLASVFHLGSLATGWGVHWYLNREKPQTDMRQAKLVPYRSLAPPPSLDQKPSAPPKFAIAPPKKPKAPPAGVPKPVPKEEAPVTTIASQQQLPFADTEGDTGLGEEFIEGVPWGEDDGEGIVIDDFPGPNDFVPVEEQPVIVEFKTPEYPRLAREAGIEGLVVVRALVDRDGRVKETLIGKGAHELLDQAALAAAMECTFKPAIQNKNPVAVWVAIPFNFHLRD